MTSRRLFDHIKPNILNIYIALSTRWESGRAGSKAGSQKSSNLTNPMMNTTMSSKVYSVSSIRDGPPSSETEKSAKMPTWKQFL